MTLEFAPKAFRLRWNAVAGATFYRVVERDALGGETVLQDAIAGSVLQTQLPVAVHRQDWQASLRLEACNTAGCSSSESISVAPGMLPTIGYAKASNAEAGDSFGSSVAVSGDGNTLAVGAPLEDSGVDGNPADNSRGRAGAVYIFARSKEGWAQQSYVKAPAIGADHEFGASVALSADCRVLAVGAPFEDSSASGVDGNSADNSLGNSGAAYVFARAVEGWTEQAYIKASSPGLSDQFGETVALSADGRTLAVGASREDSSATGTNGNEAPTTVRNRPALPTSSSRAAMFGRSRPTSKRRIPMATTGLA